MSSTYPLRIEAGATYARTFKIKNRSDGSDFDLTGYTGLAQIREDHDKPLILEIVPTINPTEATIAIRIEAEDTSDLLLSNYVWGLELYNDTDTVRLLEGPVTVSPEVVK
ncbi:MAG: hypothetical protein EBS18_03325 [Actinobacteria bacterium]|nr:hypothetical protein [Actinomycetota bacterium]